MARSNATLPAPAKTKSAEGIQGYYMHLGADGAMIIRLQRKIRTEAIIALNEIFGEAPNPLKPSG